MCWPHDIKGSLSVYHLCLQLSVSFVFRKKKNCKCSLRFALCTSSTVFRWNGIAGVCSFLNAWMYHCFQENLRSESSQVAKFCKEEKWLRFKLDKILSYMIWPCSKLQASCYKFICKNLLNWYRSPLISLDTSIFYILCIWIKILTI